MANQQRGQSFPRVSLFTLWLLCKLWGPRQILVGSLFFLLDHLICCSTLTLLSKLGETADLKKKNNYPVINLLSAFSLNKICGVFGLVVVGFWGVGYCLFCFSTE